MKLDKTVSKRALKKPHVALAVTALLTSAWLSPSLANQTLDNIPVGHWYESPNTQLENHFPTFPSGQYYGSPTAVTEAWSGGAYDTVRDQLIVWGGGHYDYAGNEIYTFDINAEQWTRETEPSLDVGGSEIGGLYPDGLPRSRHTYNNIEYVPAFDQFCSFGSSGTWPTHSKGENVLACFDFDSGTWDTSSHGVASSGEKYGFVVADPVTGKVFEHDAMSSNLKSYDPATHQWTNYSGNLYLEYYSTAAVDTKRHQLVAIGANQFYVWDLDNPGSASTPSRSGDLSMEGAQAPGFQYDPVTDKFVAWSGGSAVYTLDPDTWHWQKVTPAADNTVTPPAAMSQGTYGRFKYIPSKNLFVAYNRTSQNVFFYRLSAGSGVSTNLPNISLSSDVAQVDLDGSATISWDVTNADSCTASGDWSGAKALSGVEVMGPLSADATYTLTCSNADGSRSSTTVVTVLMPAAPTINLVADPRVIAPNDSTTLTWSATDADNCTASGFDTFTGALSLSGSELVGPLTSDTVLTVTCDGIGGTSSKNVSVLVRDPALIDGIQLSQLIDDFSSYAVGDQPLNWVDTGGFNSLNQNDSLYSIGSVDGENVFTMSRTDKVNTHSHYITPESVNWTNYRYAGQMRIGTASDGIGVTFFSDYPNSDSYYRLRSSGNAPFTIDPHPDSSEIQCLGDNNTGVIPAAGIWYNFLVEVEDTGTQTQVRAKVWENGTGEPIDWQVDCADDGARLTKGTIGVWNSAGTDQGSKYWKNLSIEFLNANNGGSTGTGTTTGGTTDTSGTTGTGSTGTGTTGTGTTDAGSTGTGTTGTGTTDTGTAGTGTTGTGSTGTDTTGSGTTGTGATGTGTTGGTTTTSGEVNTTMLPTIDLAIVHTGEYDMISWSTSRANSCEASGGWEGTRAPLGNELLIISDETTEFVLACSNDYGVATDKVSVVVLEQNQYANAVSTSGGGAASVGWLSLVMGFFLLVAARMRAALPATKSVKAKALVAAFLVLPFNVMAGDIVNVTISSAQAGGQLNVPVTFAQVFAEGDVPAGMTVGAKFSDGTEIPLQVDHKANHADGSLRHAVLTALFSDLPGHSVQQLTLFTKTANTSGAAVSLNDLLATSFDATAELNIGGTTYTASAKQLLQTGTVKTWLEGEEVSEWIVGGPVQANGVDHPHLAAYFHVRAYAGLERVRVDMVIENGWTFVSNPTRFDYDVTLKVGGQVAYTQSALPHYHHTRWHKVAWWGNAPAANVAHDVEYLQATKAVPNYKDGLTPSDSTLNSLPQSIAPMGRGMLRANFGDTGADDSIGPLPKWDALYLVSGDQRAFKSVIAHGGAAASYSIHYRDKNTGMPVSIADYPLATIQDSSLPSTSGGQAWLHDQAHQPSMAFVAYLISGDYFFMEEMQFWTTWNFLFGSPGDCAWCYRQNEKGIFGVQVRGQAWALRNLGQTAYLTPDAHPMKQYYVDRVGYNMDKVLNRFNANPNMKNLGIIMTYDAYNQFAPWMDDFYTWSVGYLAELGFQKAIPVRDIKARFPTGRMGFAANEYCYQLGAPYRYVIGTSKADADVWPDFRTLYEQNQSSAAAYECGSSAMANYLTANEEGYYDIGEMVGRPHLADSYYANLQPALAIAVDAGVASYDVEWYRFTVQNPQTPGAEFDKNPIWAVEPRNTSGTPRPVVSLSANPSAVDVDGTTTLSWTVRNADVCTAGDGWSGDKLATGSTETVGPISAETTFSLTCTGAGGNTTASTVVTIKVPEVVTPPDQSTVDQPYVGDFNTSVLGELPQGWYASGAGNSLNEALNLFGVMDLNGGSVFATQSTTDTNIHAHYKSAEAYTWANYRYTGRMRIGSSGDAIGVTFYSDYPHSDTYYRLRRYGDPSFSAFHIDPHGATCAGDTNTGIVPVADTWYHFLIEVEETDASETEVRAKVWADTDVEPADWQVLCRDTSASRLKSGTIGVWAVVDGYDAGDKYWADLTVDPLYEPTPVVVVTPPPTLSFSSASVDVYEGDDVLVSWDTTNATSCEASGDWSGVRAVSADEIIQDVAGTTSLTLTCAGDGGEVSKTLEFTALAQPTDLPDKPAVQMFTTLSGNVLHVSWTTSNANLCIASGAWEGDKANIGSEELEVTDGVVELDLTCTGPGGSTSHQVTLTVDGTQDFASLTGANGNGAAAVNYLMIVLSCLMLTLTRRFK